MKFRILVYFLCMTVFVSCHKDESLSSAQKMEFVSPQLSVNMPSSGGVNFMNQVKMVCFEIRNVAGMDQYFYEGFYDLNDAIYNSSSQMFTKVIPSFPRKRMGVVVVSQGSTSPANSYLLPLGGQGVDAKLINLPLLFSTVSNSNTIGEASEIFVSNMNTVSWGGNETSKTLNFNLKRVVGKLIVKINDPYGLMTNDVYFKVYNTYSSCFYNQNYSGSSSVQTPSLLRVDQLTKEGVLYLLPSVGGSSIGIEPVNSQFVLQIKSGDLLPITANKITTLTINYEGDKSMNASVNVQDWGEVAFEVTDDCFDITDSEGIGYKVINVGGQLWLDRDLGAKYDKPRDPLSATVQNLSSDDDWGYSFQFGRKRDGHQKRSSLTSSTHLTNPMDNSNLRFICPSNPSYSWFAPTAENQGVPLWIRPQQNNNPCPNGFRVPTFAELKFLYNRLSFDQTLGLYYVDGKRKGKTVRMYLAGKTYRPYQNGVSTFISNNALYYWTSASKWDNQYFYGNMPSIRITNTIIQVNDGDGKGLPVSTGCNVRCIIDNNTIY
ncbi:MAG: hypothetical protein RR137_01995 [Odoribacter sp.]